VAYIATLQRTTETGKGPGEDLESGRRVYREKCQMVEQVRDQSPREIRAVLDYVSYPGPS
jgi:hypothetical protein